MSSNEKEFRSADLLAALTPVLLLAAPVMYSFNLGLVQYKGKAAGPYVTAADIVALLLLLAVTLNILITRNWRRLRFPPFAAVALAVWAALGIFRQVPDLEISRGSLLKEALQLVEYLCFGYALFLFALHDRRCIGRFMDALLAVTGAVTVYGLQHYFQKGLDPFLVRSLFENNSILSAWLAISLPLLASYAFAQPAIWRKIVIGLMIVLSFPLVMNGWFLLLLVGGLALYAGLNGRWHAIGGIAVLALLCLFMLPSLPRDNHKLIAKSTSLYHQLNNEDARELGRTHVASVRLRNWQAAYITGLQRPWTGHGSSSYARAVKENFFFDPKYTERTDKIEAFDVHVDEPNSFSTYFILFVENGLVGLLLFVALMISALRWSAMAAFFQGGPVTHLGRGALASVAVAIAAAHFINVLERGLAFLFVFVIALSFALYEQAMGYRES